MHDIKQRQLCMLQVTTNTHLIQESEGSAELREKLLLTLTAAHPTPGPSRGSGKALTQILQIRCCCKLWGWSCCAGGKGEHIC